MRRYAIAVILPAILLSACATPSPSSGELQAQADLVAARETAVARATRDALSISSQATSDAMTLAQQGTAQAQNAEATSAALTAEATRVMWALRATMEAGAATSTAVAVQSTRHAESANTTATAEALAVQATQTVVAATSQAIERQDQWEANTQTVTRVGGWAILVAGLAGLAYIGWYFIPTIRARAQVIRRKHDEAEPVIITPDLLIMPMRLFSPLLDLPNQAAPMLAAPDYQDRVTARAQLPAAVSAGRGNRRIVKRAATGQSQNTWTTLPHPTDETTALPRLHWPQNVRLADLFADQRPTLEHLIIGVTIREDGRMETVGASLHQLMHVLTVGASGWGKSTWLRSLLWQIAKATEPVEVLAIDVTGSEFNLLRHWGRLHYPVARSNHEAKVLLMMVSKEISRRRELFERRPLATKLTEYNKMVEDQLAPWVVVVDEGTSLLNQSDIGDSLRDAVQTARQYGVYILLAGQSATHRVIPTQVRDNFSTRLCFHTSPSSSRVVLDDRSAGDLDTPGRAWAQLTGRELIQVQGPFVSRPEFLQAVSGGEPRFALPQVNRVPPAQEQILDLIREGHSDTYIAREVYGYTNGRTIAHVQTVRQGYDDTTHNNDRGSNRAIELSS